MKAGKNKSDLQNINDKILDKQNLAVKRIMNKVLKECHPGSFHHIKVKGLERYITSDCKGMKRTLLGETESPSKKQRNNTKFRHLIAFWGREGG